MDFHEAMLEKVKFNPLVMKIRAASRIPVLIITTPAEKREINFDELGLKHVIIRPTRIGDVVRRVKQMLKGTEI